MPRRRINGLHVRRAPLVPSQGAKQGQSVLIIDFALPSVYIYICGLTPSCGRAISMERIQLACIPLSPASCSNDDYGVHKVGNFSQVGAVSLHVYAPGWVTPILYKEVEELYSTDASGAPLDSDWADF